MSYLTHLLMMRHVEIDLYISVTILSFGMTPKVDMVLSHPKMCLPIAFRPISSEKNKYYSNYKWALPSAIYYREVETQNVD